MTLVVLAAGMGSRFGGGKQTARLGPSGEILLDYSLYDAYLAGFQSIVLVIRKENYEEVKAHGDKAAARGLSVTYVYQEIPQGRKKPYGTGHALLTAAAVVNEPFAVVNADDFYGRDAFFQLSRFFKGNGRYCLVAYELDRTLSESGGVSRGVCRADEAGHLLSVAEHTQIQATDGIISSQYGGEERILSPKTPVSLNLWGFSPEIFAGLQKEFDAFLPGAGETGEFFLPTTIDRLIQEGFCTVNLLHADAAWYGVTHREDAPAVTAALSSPEIRRLYAGL